MFRRQARGLRGGARTRARAPGADGPPPERFYQTRPRYGQDSGGGLPHPARGGDKRCGGAEEACAGGE